MQHVDALLEAGNVEHSVLVSRVESDLFHAGPATGPRLPIGRLKSLLNPSKLEPGRAARILRKGSEVVQRSSEPKDGLVHTDGLYKIQYIDASAQGGTRAPLPSIR